MHAVFSLGALLTMVSSAALSSAAAGCDLKPVDLTDLLRVQVGVELVATTSLVDPDSAEPILRYIVSLSDGSLMVLDLPPLPGELPDSPRLWLAGAGASPGWRRAGVAICRRGRASSRSAARCP